MKVYKFGGASVKDATGVRGISSIVGNSDTPLVVVISAMGKMTNAFEVLLEKWFNNDVGGWHDALKAIDDYHAGIILDLLGSRDASRRYNVFMELLKGKLMGVPSLHYDYEYDQVVSYGELLSTSIVADFWESEGLKCKWLDARGLLKTDDLYRDANVDWDFTSKLTKGLLDFDNSPIYLTQGFLGGTISNLTTTLGREGSDYTAAIIGHVMDATEVTIWKDVPGVLNADPRWYPDAVKLTEISYLDAIELAFYGAQVIHPKTLKPLQNKGIPLYVKSFLNPGAPGTKICERKGISEKVPVYIVKANQVFVTLSPHDFSFIMEDKLVEIISLFRKFRVKMNLMRNSALNFTACFDRRSDTAQFIETLQQSFAVRYNENVKLLTIRQYSQEAISTSTQGQQVLDSQITRKDARFVLKPGEV